MATTTDMVSPPPLAWVPSFAASLGRVLDCAVVHVLHPTVNALVYKLELRFNVPQTPKHIGMIWNLLQKYAAANSSVAEYRQQERPDPTRMVVRLIMKERLGLPKDVIPWEKELGGPYD